MNKIHVVEFTSGTTAKTITGLFQWNFGQILQIKGLDLPSAVEVHFALRRSGEALRRIGVTKDGVTEVEIPDVLFKTMMTSDYDIYAYVYVSDEEYGSTTHEIILKVKSRPMPDDIQNDFDEIMKAVKTLADGKVDKNQGIANNGKLLGVVDGYVVLVDAPSGTTDAVRYVEQELTEEQQEQARANIGAANVTYDTETKTLNICLGGGTTNGLIEQIEDYVIENEIEKIVIDGVEVNLSRYAKKEETDRLSEEKVDQKELENYALKDEIPTVPVQSVNGKTGAVQLSASEVGALPNSTKIPANTSDLTNNSGFITKTVTDLANYYLKTEVYTQEEIDNKLSAIPKFAIEVVSTLPTANISETTVYLIASGNEEHNLYTEYIYVDGQWEYLGKQTVDLTNYVKRAELSNYYLKSEMDSLLTTIRNSIPTQLSQFTEDSTHRTVTDTEKKTWNAKSNFSGAYGDLTGKPTIPTKTSQLTNDSNFVDKSVTDNLSEEIAVQQNTIEQHENQILALAQGTPPYASTTDKMTDTSKIYLGSNGNLWTYGEKESENAIEWYDQRKLSYTIGDSYDSYTSVDNYCATNLLPVSEGETITISATDLTSDSDSCRVLYYDSAQNVSSIAVDQNASGGTWETTLTIPTGVHFIALRAFYRTSNSGWLNAAITIPSIGEAGSYGWIDTGINYANYSLSDSDKDIIAQKVLDILDVSYVSLENVISIGTYTLKYDSEEITDIGVVTT